MAQIWVHTKDNNLDSLFSTAYLPPVSYLLDMFKADSIAIEQHEHFLKQSYMNRCRIFGPNGILQLIIPVDHTDLYTIPIRDVKISNETAWHKSHWKSICTAYRNAPYFEYFEEDFAGIFKSKPDFLFDFNLRLTEMLLKLFRTEKTIRLTDNYEKDQSGLNDLRNLHHPKKNLVTVKHYRQVFSDKHGFLNDPSSIDLLFNVDVKEYFIK